METTTWSLYGFVLALCCCSSCSPKPQPPSVFPRRLKGILLQDSLHTETLVIEEAESWQFEYSDTIEVLNRRLSEHFLGIPRFADDSVDSQKLRDGKPWFYFLIVEGKKVTVLLYTPVEYGSTSPGYTIRNANTKTTVTAIVSRK